MSKILNQAWEDVASDVTGAIEEAVKPLFKKAMDEIYCGLLDATQDYLKDNLAFNIASRISTAEREAAEARQENQRLREANAEMLGALTELSDVFAFDGENSVERFDRLADMFHKATGHMAPGKDPPRSGVGSEEQRCKISAIYDAWYLGKVTRARAAIAKAESTPC